MKTLIVSNYMSSNPVSIGVDLSLGEARRIMEVNQVRHLPVLEGKKIKGIISHRDIALVLAERKEDPTKLSVKDAYIDTPYRVSPAEPLKTVVGDMIALAIGSALVEENGELVGIFTVHDALRAFLTLLD